MPLTPDTLQAQRKALGLSLRALATLVPCHWTTLGRIEGGQRPLTPRMAASVSRALTRERGRQQGAQRGKEDVS